MTLLELLRQELPKRGGWPEGAAKAISYSNIPGVHFWDNDGFRVDYSDLTNRALGEAIVTREQYEATGWDGVGLPPIGAAVDYIPDLLAKSSKGDNKPEERTTVNVVSLTQYPNNGNKVVIATWFTESGGMRASVFSPRCLRPLRTEAERAIDEMVQLSGVSTGAAKILYDAGYRK